jgi:carbonic anhydrase
MEIDIAQAITEANGFANYWTYDGSLTSPPCTEGIRWFVSADILSVGTTQMQEVLRVSTYSARVEQDVWAHGVGL